MVDGFGADRLSRRGQISERIRIGSRGVARAGLNEVTLPIVACQVRLWLLHQRA